jgi:glycosyltransferase involved in cell wall biosynthesis
MIPRDAPLDAAPVQRIGRILWFNFACDLDDPALGFAVSWINAVAKHCDHIDVITQRQGRLSVAENVDVYSLGKELGHGRPQMLIAFYHHLLMLLRHHRYQSAFAHMIPMAPILAALFLKARGIPIVLWYAHPSADWRMRLAHRVSSRVVTSLPGAFPIPSEKVCTLGQGIDTDVFRPSVAPQDEPPMILCVGRISRVKNIDKLLRAAAILARDHGRKFRVVVLGNPLTQEDDIYASELRRLAASLGIADKVEFHPAVPRAKLPAWYARCRAHVNLTPTGFGDKVALEAMSCGRACIVTNTGFRETLGELVADLLVPSGKPEDLARRLDALLDLPPEGLERMGQGLREQVVRLHSLDGLASRLVLLMGCGARDSHT